MYIIYIISFQWPKFPGGPSSQVPKFPVAQVPGGPSSQVAQVPRCSSSRWPKFPVAQVPSGRSSQWPKVSWPKFTRPEGVVLKLTEELKSPSNSGSKAKRLIHETRSAPGDLDKLASVWECSTCTFHNPAANLICDMCRFCALVAFFEISAISSPQHVPP